MRRRLLRVLALGLVVGGLLAAPLAARTVIGARVTVTTSATLISQAGSDLGPVLIKNAGLESVFLGGATVLTTTGYELAAGETVSIMLGTNEAVYGIVVTGPVVVHTLENRR